MSGACLSDDQLRTLESVGPGQIPAEVAAHLASCESCQRRLLFGGRQPAARRETPSLRRAFLRVVLVLVALAMVLVSFRIMAG